MYTNTGNPSPVLLDLDLLDIGALHREVKLPIPSPASLAAARRDGVLDAVICRPSPSSKGRYEILRHLLSWRVAQAAQWPAVPAVVYQLSETDAAALVRADIESWKERERPRKTDPITQAEELLAAYQTEEGPQRGRITRLAARYGVTRASIWQKLAILELPDEVKRRGREHQLGFSQLRVLLGLSPGDQIRLARLSVERGLTVKRLIAHLDVVKKTRPAPSELAPLSPGSEKSSSNPDLRRLEERLRERLLCGVKITQDSLTLDIGENIPALTGVLEKCAEALRISGGAVAFDNRRLAVRFAGDDAIQRFLEALGLGQDG